jgi:hypothetical protein
MRFVIAAFLFSMVTMASADDADARALGKTVSGECTAITLVTSAGVESNCWVAQTPSFRIFWRTSEANLRELATECERLAARQQEHWLGKDCSLHWLPKCDVVVHQDMAAYVQCLGPGSEATSGCASITYDQGRIVARRIDLRGDASDWRSEVLPHELTHVVLAERFTRCRIAPWADEGIAMLAESPERLERRLTALRRAATAGRIYAAGELINVRSSPDLASRDAFYGQSLVLVGALLQWGTREQLLQFVESSQMSGPDRALREIYGNHDWNDLEHRLREQTLADRQLTWAGDRSAASRGPLAATSVKALR